MAKKWNRAADVAEKVMKWPKSTSTSGSKDLPVFMVNGHHKLVGVGEWNPYESADDDYEVLKRIRESFGHTWQGWFQKLLAGIWTDREASDDRDCRWHLSATGAGWQYEPGDYATAALATVLSFGGAAALAAVRAAGE